jgi:hypothetical protein
MKKSLCAFLCRALKDQNAQILPMMAIMMLGFIGMTGVVIDIGRVYYAYNQLQASTQAAALAGAEAISNTALAAPSTVAAQYGSQSAAGTQAAGLNVQPILQNVHTYSLLSCNTFVENTLAISCITYAGSGLATANAIQVMQQATVKTYFVALFGTRSINLTAYAASARAGAPSVPYNVAVIVDTTASMNTSDTNCVDVEGSGRTKTTYYTRLQCAMITGIQTLLKNMAPCYSDETSCNASNTTGVATPSVDRVALFTFPNISTATVSHDVTCPSSDPTIEPYSFPSSTPTASSTYSSTAQLYYAKGTSTTPVQLGTTTYPTTYAVTYGLGDADSNGFVSDYKAEDVSQVLDSTSKIAIAIGAGSCNGLGDPGGAGTYYAGSIYAATAALAAEQAANPNAQNVIILISDGDAESSGTGSWTASCTEGSSYCAPTSCGTSKSCTSAGITWSCTKSGTTTTCTNSSVNEMGNASTTSGLYPSTVNECQQAVTAAKYAVSSGIVSRVYAVAYGAESTGCSTDTGKSGSAYTNPCATLQGIASDLNYFYADNNQSGASGACGNAVATGTLNQIFTDIASEFSAARLVPIGVFPSQPTP